MNLSNMVTARQWVFEQEHFDMSEWLRIFNKQDDSDLDLENIKSPDCGTVSCFAGTVESRLLMLGQIQIDQIGRHPSQAQIFLGLTDVEALKLFNNLEYYYVKTFDLSSINKEMVLEKIDAIIEAGEFV